MDALHRTRRFEVQRIDYGIMEVHMCGFLEKSDHQGHGASPESILYGIGAWTVPA